MNNFIAFFNYFFNSVVLLVCFAAAGALGIFLGAKFRKSKDASNAAKANEEGN